MTAFLRDLLSRPGAARTVILLEPDTMSAPRQYEVRPGVAFYAVAVAVVAGAAVLVAAVVLTPFRGALLGPGSAEVRAAAERSAARAEALEDSMAVQVEQIAQLRALITGSADTLAADGAGDFQALPVDEAGEDVRVQVQPAAGAEPSASRPPPAAPAPPARPGGAAEAYLTGLRAPALPPLDGVVSRGFSPARGHYGLDLAADAGTPVLAAGDGTVVLADWTQDGGLTVAVQHAGGYLSIYKHNSYLLRRAGDRVRSREAIARSGNSGEITSGPHLHVEVWRDGRARDPATFFSLR